MAAPNRWTNDDYDKAEIEAIQRMAGPVYAAHSGDISTYLAHCTRQRYEQSRQWQPGTMYDQLFPAIARFEELFCGQQQTTYVASVLGDTDYGTTSMTKYSMLSPPEKVLFVSPPKKG